MLTRLIANLYVWIIEIYLWLLLLISGIVGYNLIVPMLIEAGWLVGNETIWRISGGILFPVGTFFLSALAIGPILLLVEIRKSVRTLETISNAGKVSVQPLLHVEPSLRS